MTRAEHEMRLALSGFFKQAWLIAGMRLPADV